MALVISISTSKRYQQLSLLISVIGNLGILSYFKYTDFALESLKTLLGPMGQHLPHPLNLILPVGISFYTFQTMSYTIDVYRGVKKAEKDFILVALYVSFFPQLVAGPIERAKDLMPQLRIKQHFSFTDLETGIRLICWGLLKKIVVGDRLTCAAYGAYLDPQAQNTGTLAFAAVAMFVVVYLDFSAYSEIARGTASLFGIRLSRNFNFPHTATNIAEYWRRWHITLSRWVLDYLFKPLGGFRIRNPLQYSRVILLTMGLVGLWHGAQWTFVLWGLLNGVCLFSYHIFSLHILRKHRKAVFLTSNPWLFFSWVFSMLIRILLSILFFSPNLHYAIIFYDRLCIHPTIAGFNENYVLIGFAVIAFFWVFHFLHERIARNGGITTWPPIIRGGFYACLSYVILFAAMETAEPFIYFQF
ncbi:MAG: hypothetical protein PHZ02_09320 [Desulfocapsaceae bacterium]|nr:hypothetical protein [Desulfocapsaceae bacterium]